MARHKKPPGAPLDEHKDKRVISDPDKLADGVVQTLIEGRGLIKSPYTRELAYDERKSLNRALGEPVEAFNERLASKLRTLADKIANSIEADVDNDRLKPGEKGFLFSVMHDKRLSLDGSRALQNASVNIQVNNYGAAPKAALLADLDGLAGIKPATPIHSEPAPDQSPAPATDPATQSP